MTSGIMRGALQLFVCLTIVALPCIAAAGDDEVIAIKYHWKKGQQDRFQMTQTSVSRMKTGQGGASQAQTTQTHASTVRLQIEDVSDDGVADARWTIEKVRMEMRQVIGEPMVLDSENPVHRQNPDAVPLFAMIDRTISFQVSPTGEVTDVQGVDAILNDLIANYKDSPNANEIIETLRNGFNAEALRTQISQTLDILPPQPVKVGEEWKKSIDQQIPMVGNIRTDQTATLVAVHENEGSRQAEVRTASTMTPTDQTKETPMQMSDSKASHVLLFDLSAGRVESYVIESEMHLAGQPEGGSPMSMHVTTKTSLKRLAE